MHLRTPRLRSPLLRPLQSQRPSNRPHLCAPRASFSNAAPSPSGPGLDLTSPPVAPIRPVDTALVSAAPPSPVSRPLHPRNMKDALSRDNARLNALIRSISYHCAKGELIEAEACLDHLKRELFEPPIEIYAALISGYVRNKQLHKAQAIFMELKDSGKRPPDRIYSSLVQGCLQNLPRISAIHQAVAYWMESQRLGIPLAPHAITALLRSIFARGESICLEHGITLLKHMITKGYFIEVRLWRTIIIHLSSGTRPKRSSLWEVLNVMRLADIPLDDPAVHTLLASAVTLPLETLRYIARYAKGQERSVLISRLVDLDWDAALSAFEYFAKNKHLGLSQPRRLLIFAPTLEKLRLAITEVEAANIALQESDFAWYIANAHAVTFPRPPKEPAPQFLDWIYDVWRARHTKPKEIHLDRAIIGLLKTKPLHPIGDELWKERASRGELPVPLLEVVFAAIARGETKWVGLAFTELLRKNRTTTALMLEYQRLTPLKTARVAEIVTSLDRRVAHTPESLNALARAALEEEDSEMALKLIEQAKYLGFAVHLDTWDAMARSHAINGKPLDALQVLRQVHDRSPFGSPNVPSERTANDLLSALLKQDLISEALRFYKRLHCNFYVPTLAAAVRVLAAVNSNLSFALQLLDDAAAGRVTQTDTKIEQPVLLRRLCVRMLKAAQEAHNRTALAQVIVWMHTHKIPLREATTPEGTAANVEAEELIEKPATA